MTKLIPFTLGFITAWLAISAAFALLDILAGWV